MNKAQKDLSLKNAQLEEHKANQQAQEIDLRVADKEYRKLSKQKYLIEKKALQARQKCDGKQIEKDEKSAEMKIKMEQQDIFQRKVDEKKKEINAKIHERKLLNGDLVTQEEAERKAKDEVQMYQ